MSEIALERKRKALEEALQSAVFARSEQLRGFLTFICELEIAGRAGEISEYAIATEALGRPKDYNCAEDSAVRNRAHALRQKLQELYTAELREAEVCIELPKGSYVPRFLEAPPRTLSPIPSHARPGSRAIAAFGIGIALGGLVLGLLGWRPPSARPDPVLADFWGPLARRDANALVCVAAPVHLRVRQNLENACPADLPRIPTPAELYHWYGKHRPPAPAGKLYVLPTVNAVPLGDALGAVTLTSVLSGFGAPYNLVSERMFSVPLLRSRNVLLIGDPEESPTARNYLALTQLISVYDPAAREYVIRRREGAAGPAYVPRRSPDGKTDTLYGLITVMPSEGAADAERRMVVFSGGASAGTQGAIEFFSSPAKLRQFKQQLEREGHGRVPPVYQVVVKCRTDNSLLLSFDYEWHCVGRDSRR
jgi:hypothetical protein